MPPTVFRLIQNWAIKIGAENLSKKTGSVDGLVDLGPEELRIETITYRMRNQLRIAGRVVTRLQTEGGEPKLHMQAKKGEPLKIDAITTSDKTSTELAVVMSQFLLPESDLYVDKLLKLLGSVTNDSEVLAFVKQAMEVLKQTRTKTIDIIVNGKPLNSEDVFVEIATNLLFADDTAAIQFRAQLESDPFLGPTKWFIFHEYCLQVYYFLSSLMTFFEAEEGRLPRFQRDNICIYCKDQHKKFSTVEHTLPESLGNYMSVLPRGYVCDECQVQNSTFEKKVLEQLPFSLLKVFTVQHTKKGKFPSSQVSQTRLERMSPNRIRIISQDGKNPILNEKLLPTGEMSFQISSESKIDHAAIGQMLAKAVLGAMTLEKGRNYVLDVRFDAVRDFIKTGKGLNNQLAILKVNHPSQLMEISWNEYLEFGVIAGVVIHGIIFLIGLTGNSKLPIQPDFKDKVIIFDI